MEALLQKNRIGLLLAILLVLVVSISQFYHVSHPFTTNKLNYNYEYQINEHEQKEEDIFNRYILFLRMYHGSQQYFFNDFFYSFRFFWPFHAIQANLIIVLDDESDLDHKLEVKIRNKFDSELSNEIEMNFFNYYITFEKPRPTVYNDRGWNRQQVSMFWCDKFLEKLNISDRFEWVGFVDSDTLFTSLITPESIFSDPYNIQNPKPYMIVSLGFGSNPNWWKQVSYNTKSWFGKTELFKHMMQFPATFKIEHIKQVREQSLKYWYKDKYTMQHFNEIVTNLTANPDAYASSFAQFNIFATFIWYYAQNEYIWYFDPSHNNEWLTRQKMHGIKTGTFEQLFNVSNPEKNIHNGETESLVRIAIHSRHIPKQRSTTNVSVIVIGYCFSINWQSEYCTKIKTILTQTNIITNNSYVSNEAEQSMFYCELFEFGISNAWCNKAFRQNSLIAQNKYYESVKNIINSHYWLQIPIKISCEPSTICSNTDFDNMAASDFNHLVMSEKCRCHIEKSDVGNEPKTNIHLSSKCIADSELQHTFNDIYQDDLWLQSGDSKSGVGSTIKYALDTILYLKQFMKNHNIKSFADIPCGDTNWIFSVQEINTIDFYFGGDISSTVIQRNQLLYKNHQNKLFKIFDLTKCILPQYYYNNNIHGLHNFDFILTRDVLQHLSLKNALKFITNVVMSNVSYWAVTSYQAEYNKNIQNGDFYHNDLFLYPFNLSSNNVNIIFNNQSHRSFAVENDHLIIYKIDDQMKNFVMQHFNL